MFFLYSQALLLLMLLDVLGEGNTCATQQNPYKLQPPCKQAQLSNIRGRAFRLCLGQGVQTLGVLTSEWERIPIWAVEEQYTDWWMGTEIASKGRLTPMGERPQDLSAWIP